MDEVVDFQLRPNLREGRQQGISGSGIEDITITVGGEDTDPDNARKHIFLGRDSFVEEEMGPIPGGGVRMFAYEADGD